MELIDLKLIVWRQLNQNIEGSFETYYVKDVDISMSFLEMLDVLNEQLTIDSKDPIAFDHDCREGICGMCGCMVNGRASGSKKGTTLCQLHMRYFNNGDSIIIEPFRALAFKVVKDLVVDRSAMDKIVQSGCYISINTGSAKEANTISISQKVADLAMNAAQCIGCGSCVAACPNSSAMLFVGAKISQLSLLPQGVAEANDRVVNVVKIMDFVGFGNCSNHTECEVECPKEISVSNIARMNREYFKSKFFSDI